MISNSQEPPVREILETNVLSIVQQIFSFADNISEEIRAMKLEAIWILTNLAYGIQEDTDKMLSHPMNLLNIVNEILAKGDKDLMMVEQTLWLIGNLTGDSAINRDVILH